MAEQFHYNDNKTIVLIVDTEGREASLKLSDNSLFFDESEIADLITKAGIKHGFENAKTFMQETGQLKEIGKPFLIAKASPMKIPSFIYKFLIPEESISPLPVDSISGLKITEVVNRKSVPANTPLARLIIQEDDSPRTDIFGNSITIDHNIAEISIALCGEGVTYKEGQLVSTVSGFPYIDTQKRLSVCSLLSYDQDIVIDEGDYLLFPCSLCIYGNLTGKGRIEITGDLAVTENISYCSIYTTGKILVKGKAEHTTLIADNSIGVNEVTRSKIVSGNMLKLEGRADSSLLVAGDSILGDEKGSICTDCSVIGVNKIKVAAFKKVKKAKPFLTLTYAPYYRELLAYWQNILKVEIVSSIDKSSSLSDKQKSSDFDLEVIKERITLIENEMLKRFPEPDLPKEILKEEDKSLRKVLYENKSITICGKLHSGTEIRIYAYMTLIKRDLSKIVLKVSDDGITQASF